MSLILPGLRLVLREFSPDDWEDVYAFTSRPEVSRYQAWGRIRKRMRGRTSGAPALRRWRKRAACTSWRWC